MQTIPRNITIFKSYRSSDFDIKLFYANNTKEYYHFGKLSVIWLWWQIVSCKQYQGIFPFPKAIGHLTLISNCFMQTLPRNISISESHRSSDLDIKLFHANNSKEYSHFRKLSVIWLWYQIVLCKQFQGILPFRKAIGHLILILLCFRHFKQVISKKSTVFIIDHCDKYRNFT